jgi:probable HAF family extracellular repeat protein
MNSLKDRIPMNRRRRLGLATLFVIGIMGLHNAQPVASQSATYGVTDLGTLGGQRSVAFGIDKHGRVVGHAETASGSLHAFLDVRGQLFDLGTLGGRDSHAYSINDLGVIVGRAQNAGGQYRPFVALLAGPMFDLGSLDQRLHGPFSTLLATNNVDRVIGYYQTSGPHAAARNRVFVYEKGTITDLGTFGGEDGIVSAINDFGQMVGSFGTDPHADYSDRRAFLATGTTAIALPTLGGRVTMATDLNNLAQVVGYYQVASGERRGFLYSGGVMQDLGTLPGGTQSFGYAINNLGEVVGSSGSASGNLRAFIYDGGVMRDLNSLLPANSCWLLTEARDINDSGQIVGAGIVNGQQRAFLLTLVN